MKQIKDILYICQEVLDGEQFLEDTIIYDIKKLVLEIKSDNTPRHIGEWGENHGDCLWWSFPIVEPPYCGTPLDCDFPDYSTHFTRLNLPIHESVKPPYSQDEFKKAKALNLDLNDWNDYSKFFGLGEEPNYDDM